MAPQTAPGDDAVAMAFDFLSRRRAAHDDAASVLVHGDAHALNALDAGEGAYKMIDPDGLNAEPAYDLGVLLREWDEVLAGDPLGVGQRRCQRLAALSDLDPDAIWQWGFVERVSTGLACLAIGMADEGRKMLHVADVWAAA